METQPNVDSKFYQLSSTFDLTTLSKQAVYVYHNDVQLIHGKDYTFSNVHQLLELNNFKQFYKAKMPFRKTFEYIYINKKKL